MDRLRAGPEHRRALQSLPDGRRPDRLAAPPARIFRRRRVQHREAVRPDRAVDDRVRHDAVMVRVEAGDDRVVVGEGRGGKDGISASARMPRAASACRFGALAACEVVPAPAVERDEDECWPCWSLRGDRQPRPGPGAKRQRTERHGERRLKRAGAPILQARGPASAPRAAPHGGAGCLRVPGARHRRGASSPPSVLRALQLFLRALVFLPSIFVGARTVTPRRLTVTLSFRAGFASAPASKTTAYWLRRSLATASSALLRPVATVSSWRRPPDCARTVAKDGVPVVLIDRPLIALGIAALDQRAVHLPQRGLCRSPRRARPRGCVRAPEARPTRAADCGTVRLRRSRRRWPGARPRGV